MKKLGSVFGKEGQKSYIGSFQFVFPVVFRKKATMKVNPVGANYSEEVFVEEMNEKLVYDKVL